MILIGSVIIILFLVNNNNKNCCLGIDDGEDIDPTFLTGIYERMKVSEFQPGSDHVTQVAKVEQSIVGKRPVS